MKQGSKGPTWILGEDNSRHRNQGMRRLETETLSGGKTAGRTGCLDRVNRWKSRK